MKTKREEIIKRIERIDKQLDTNDCGGCRQCGGCFIGKTLRFVTGYKPLNEVEKEALNDLRKRYKKQLYDMTTFNEMSSDIE